MLCTNCKNALILKESISYEQFNGVTVKILSAKCSICGLELWRIQTKEELK